MSNRLWYTAIVSDRRFAAGAALLGETPMKAAVRPALFRIARIDEKLRRRCWPNAVTLARELEVTPRTIHRDLDFLRDQFHAHLLEMKRWVLSFGADCEVLGPKRLKTEILAEVSKILDR